MVTLMHGLPNRSYAAALAEQLLVPLDSRWRHTQAVAARAEQLVAVVPAADQELLVVAAWWHDVGYSTDLAVTGFHPLDGARYLIREGYPERLCSLVAHHSAATRRIPWWAGRCVERGPLSRPRFGGPKRGWRRANADFHATGSTQGVR